MGKILKDPYELYGEAKPQAVRKDPYGYVSSEDAKVAPDYNAVKKALLVKRLIWMVPSGIGIAGFIWLLFAIGGPFLFWFSVIAGGTAAFVGTCYGIVWIIEKGEKASEVLNTAKKKGVREPNV